MGNRLWNTGAVIQESFQNSSLGKMSISFRVKKNKVLFVSSGCINIVLSASELMKCVVNINH